MSENIARRDKLDFAQTRGRMADELEQVLFLAGFEGLNEFCDVLCAVAGAEEQRVGCFDDDQIADADGRDKFSGAPDKISFGIESLRGPGENILAGMCGEVIV